MMNFDRMKKIYIFVEQIRVLQLHQMNNLKRVIGDSILRSDLLSTHANLRYGGQPVYESCCTGIVSILTVSAFLAIFVLKFMTVLQLQDITAFQHLTDNIESSESISDVMFAMTIEGLGMTTIDKYFEFSVTEVSLSRPQGSSEAKVKTERVIILSPCKIDYWQNMGISNMATLFQKRGMSSFYCPTQQFSIQGSSDDDTYIYADLKLKKCTPTSSYCEKNATIRDAYYQSYVNANEYFSVRLYIKDAIVSPTQQDAVSNYLERDILMSFSTTTGTVGYLKIADYEIETDVNIMPWNQYQTQTGYFIDRFQTTTVPSSIKFLYVKLQKSTKKLIVTREYGKLDDLLSYVGGLFGLLFYCIQFIVMSYNEYRYQLAIGEVLFNYDDKGNQFKEKEMDLWSYTKYSIYDWLAFFGCQPDSWTSMKKLHETRNQVNEQLDVRYLMKKLRYLQNVTEVLVSDEQQVCLHLTQLPTISKIRKVRKVAEFYTRHRNPNPDEETQSDFQEKRLVNTRLMQFSEVLFNPNQNPNNLLRVRPSHSHQVITQLSNMDYRINIPNEQGSSENTQQNQDDLAVELYSALLKLGQNERDPVNQKIIAMLRPQLVRKIRTRSRKRSTDINNMNNSSMFIELKKQQKTHRQEE